MVNKSERTQKMIENDLLQKSRESAAPGATVGEVLGPMEDWHLQVGEYEFFLNPMTAHWMFYDPVHSCWVRTGHQAGEGWFTLDEQKELAFTPAESPMPIPPIPIPNWQRNPQYQPFFDLEERFLSLLESFQFHDIAEDEFLQSVHQLRHVDERGIWWQIRPEDGGWYRWDGSSWVDDVPYEKEK